MKIGVLVDLRADTNIRQAFEKVRDLDLQSCQVCVWDCALYTVQNAKALREASAETGVEISALWAGWSGPRVWDFYQGPVTLGLVPAPYRDGRLRELLKASDFAAMLGVTDVATHVGFLPENPNDPDYAGVVAALRHLANYMKAKGQYFLFETGQETPTTLCRAIEDIGTGNVGINFDTANCILYGKANSVDAAGIFGKYVRNLHCKDGCFPHGRQEPGARSCVGPGKSGPRAGAENTVPPGLYGPVDH